MKLPPELAGKAFNEAKPRRLLTNRVKIKAWAVVLNRQFEMILALLLSPARMMDGILPLVPCLAALVNNSLRIKASGMAASLGSSPEDRSQTTLVFEGSVS